jgi:hypothetical protein
MESSIGAFNGIAIGQNAMQYANVNFNNTAIGQQAMGDIRQYFIFSGSIASASFGGTVATGLSASFLFTGTRDDLRQVMMQQSIPFYSVSASFANWSPAPTFNIIRQDITGSTIQLAAGTTIPNGASATLTITPFNATSTITNYALSNNNTAIGPNAMFYFPGGQIGPEADPNIGYTIGQYNNVNLPGTGDGGNTAIGPNALQGIPGVSLGGSTPLRFRTGSAGQYNTAVGPNALKWIYKGSNNIAIGSQAMLGDEINPILAGENTAIGSLALSAIRVGAQNSIIGYKSSTALRTGSLNTNIGSQAAAALTIGFNNTFVGYQAGGTMASGSFNTSLGYQSLYNIGAGSFLNTAIGYQAGIFSSGSAQNNVYIGSGAGPSVATTENSKLYIASGSGNPLIGGNFAAKTVTISGSLLMSGSIIPNVDASSTSSFTLGSLTAAWKKLYVGTGSIEFVDNGVEVATISVQPDGAIKVPSLYTDGTFTVNTFITQSTITIISQSALTGSTIFGSSSLDTHQFTGSLFVSGNFYLLDIPASYTDKVIMYDDTTGRFYYTGSSAFKGDIGPTGPTGSSAYQTWIAQGNIGSESDFLLSLQGVQGLTGPIGPAGPDGPQGDPGQGFVTGYGGFDNTVLGSTQVQGTFYVSDVLTANNGVTGSLYGTSSWAKQALTSSYFDGVINGGTF